MNSSIDSNKIIDLITELKDANYKYRIGEPILTDTEFDDKVDILKTFIDENEFEKFRSTLTEERGKIKHPFVMGSLDKIKAFDDTSSIKCWVSKTIPDTGDITDGLFISSKIDGCSARITYSNGKLIAASTRGDGNFGVDILSKVALFVPNEVSSKFSGDIRGEITLTHETFEGLMSFNGKEYKNLRNATAGLINSKDVLDEEISFLRFFPYEIMGTTGMTKTEQFKKLKSLGFETALSKELTDIYNDKYGYVNDSQFDNVLLSIYNEFSENSKYDIDGLVVSDINDTNVFENRRIPEHTVAVKFNHMTSESKLIDVVWNVSKNGDLHPVGVIEPVNVGGSTIVNVTLNNLRIIKEQGLKLGSIVTILKSGDVIPKIISVRNSNDDNESDIVFPKVCPSCNMELYYEENCLYPHCNNSMCDDVVHNKILHFITKLGIKHVSVKTIAKFGIKSISDLISLKPDEGAVKTKFYNDINKLMFGASKEDLLCAFDYDGVSSLIISKMIGHYGYDNLLNSSFDELDKNKPFGVGSKFLRKFVEGFKEIKNEYNSIISNERYYGNSMKSNQTSSVVGGIFSGKGFVVTGALNSMSREEFKSTVIVNGGMYQSSVSKKTSYLVCNDISTATSKVKKAESLGVMVIDENKFLNMLKEGTDGFAIF